MKLPLPNSRQRQRVPYVGCQDRFPGWQEATLGHSWRLCLCITATKYLILGGGGRNRTGIDGFAGRCTFLQFNKMLEFDTRLATRGPHYARDCSNTPWVDPAL